jgi:transcriptional regulator of arginine metabolism
LKSRRQMRIIELVSQNVITSQEALCEALAKDGINVTQATVSRDVKELNLVRVPSGDGRYKYALMPGDPSLVYKDRFRRLFSDCCIGIGKSGNIILVKTLSGAASAVGEAVDGLSLNGVLGTVAGDDALLVVVADGADPAEVLTNLRKIAGL